MGGRSFHIAVMISWLLAMGWLFVEKLLPTFRNGDVPAYEAYIAEQERTPEPACWRLELDDEKIGWGVVRSIRRGNGTIRVQSLVQFEALPVDRLFVKLMGSLGPVVRQAVVGRGDLRLDLTVITTMEFAAGGQLRGFETRIQSGPSQQFMRVEGTVVERRMQLLVYGPAEGAAGVENAPREPYKYEIDMPPEALVSDSFSPQPRLANLRVGQRWTAPVYRPFPPGRSAEIVEACVECETSILYAGEGTPVLRVVFRREAGSGISADQEPTGRMWVRADGTVLRQEIRVANLQLTFHRLPGNPFQGQLMLLDPAWDE